MKADREVFIKTLQATSAENQENSRENRKALKAVAESSEAIKDTSIEIKDELQAQSAQRVIALEIMQKFAEKVIVDHELHKKTLEAMNKPPVP